jgi:hypothetical protein
MKRNLAERLAALDHLTVEELKSQWELAYRTPAPRLPPALMRLGVAYRIQELALGGLKRGSAARLSALATGRRPAASIKPGTRLVRSWNGRTISVEVEEGGFQFEDRQYRSLTAIAREVTGSPWSGPRFFGLTGGAAHG